MKQILRRFFVCVLALIGTSIASPDARAQDDSPTAKDILKVPVSAARAPLKRALVIGLDGYTIAPPLRACQKDARAFASFLQTQWGFAPDCVTLITDDDRPTNSVLKKRVRVWLSSLRGGEEVVVFYSGHGVWAQGQEWLVPLDGDVADVPGSCVSYTQLSLDLQSRKPRRVLLFTDACRNLAPAGAKSGQRASEFGQGAKSLSPARERPEFAELRSCEAGQISQERTDGSGGAFTHFLLRALAGDPDAAPDGVLTFEKLRDYVERRTAAYVAGMGEEQNPFGVSSYGAMVLAQWQPGSLGLSLDAWKVVPPTVPTPPQSVNPQTANPNLNPNIATANAELGAAWDKFVKVYPPHPLGPTGYEDRAAWSDVSKALLKGATNTNRRAGETGRTPFHLAAQYDDVTAVQYFLDKGVDVNTQDPREETPLHMAALANAKQTVLLLLSKDADVNARNDGGETPLHFAAQSNADQVLRLLVSRGVRADVNAKTSFDATPLHSAAFYNADKAVTFLLGKGADMNAKDTNGETPVFAAVSQDADKAMQVFLDAGTDITARSRNGSTLLGFARASQSYKVIPLLEAAGVKRY